MKRERARIAVRGAVQGVGFRPFVFRLATELGIAGSVLNTSGGVIIEAEGERGRLDEFFNRLRNEKPPRAIIQQLETRFVHPLGESAFTIRHSANGCEKTATILPDIAACPDCLREIFDPNNRRYLYPFTNCTNCGPRFSIIEELPYDRANTSMKSFVMCPECQAEYDDPQNRRFHAQPNACPRCGPHLELRAGSAPAVRIAALATAAPETSDAFGSARRDAPIGHPPLRRLESLIAAASAIRSGKIVAVKGLGGFHLMVDAQNEQAVRRLRERKHREEKPFALMFPSLDAIKNVCDVSPLEERLLCSAEAPIVLIRKLANDGEDPSICLAASIAPGNPNLGVMLPYTPLHHLLMRELGFPVVATSGNLSDEPICTDNEEALERLDGIADLFLVHNRPIVRHVDDSIVRVMAGREMMLRRARGYAPLPISVAGIRGQVSDVRYQVSGVRCQGGGDSARGAEPDTWNLALDPKRPVPETRVVLAVGAHLKNTVALAIGENAFISQHIGDLETEQALAAFHRSAEDLPRLYDATPSVIACDLHPDYLSTQFALERRPPVRRDSNFVRHDLSEPLPGAPIVVRVQHHVAHVLSCMAENELAPPVLGVSWDGTGYGLDETVWGGEFFLVAEESCERVAHLRQFRLPGGDKAIKEPRRSALGILYEMVGERAFDRTQFAPLQRSSDSEISALGQMLRRGVNAPMTSSAGRLFDAVAALVGLRQTVAFEGQAAMELEFLGELAETNGRYEFSPGESGVQSPRSKVVLDWEPTVRGILADVEARVPVAQISAKFHNTLAEMIVTVARNVGVERVALSGGCFQNRYLTERSIARLNAEGFQPYWHRHVPPNDGGIALGQIAAALRASATQPATRNTQHVSFSRFRGNKKLSTCDPVH